MAEKNIPGSELVVTGTISDMLLRVNAFQMATFKTQNSGIPD